MQEQPISTHEYFFPFSWRTSTDIHIDRDRHYKAVEKLIFKHLDTWVEIKASQYTEKHYNERVYFYHPVQEILYPSQTNTLVKVFIKDQVTDSDFVKIRSIDQLYTLKIQDIQLKIYRTGIGILSFLLLNHSVSDDQGIMCINALSKTIYPYRLPLEEIYKDFFPKEIIFNVNHKQYREVFDKNYMTNQYQVNQCVMNLLGKNFTCTHAKSNSVLQIHPLMNNRMFVLCMTYDKQLLKQLQHKSKEQREINQFFNFSYKEKGEKQKQIHLPKVMYSIGRFSLIAITKNRDDAYSYNQLVTLALMQRASILHFSNQVAYISALEKYALIYAIRQMYEIYIEFTTRIYFDEVTVDVEGTRIYNTLMDQLQVQKELKQLDFEMKEIHEYAMLIENNQSRTRMDLLTIVGAALVIPTFVTGFFGMNILQDKFINWWEHKEVALWFNSYVFIPILLVLIFYTWGDKRNKYLHFKRGALISILLMSILFGIIYGCGLSS